MNEKDKKKHMNDFRILSWMHNYESTIKEFMSSVSMAGADSFVVEENVDRVLQKVTYTLNCVKEDYLCHNYLMVHAKYKVMTSATVGSRQHFATNIGSRFMKPDEKMIFTDVPNIFDFSKSPIYFIPQYKMSYQNKKMDFPKIQDIIYKILSSDTYKDVRGMINTGSYENARAIYQNAPPNVRQRLCMYLTSKDKADVIVVSATPCEALEREWAEHDIAKYVKVIAGQEMGSKKEVIAQAKTKGYDDDRILMIGDAPGDHKAAKSNGALFYPINPGKEEDSWEALSKTYLEVFFGGRYKGECEEKLLKEFDTYLPSTPWWKNAK